jgi:hypothetical protein
MIAGPRRAVGFVLLTALICALEAALTRRESHWMTEQEPRPAWESATGAGLDEGRFQYAIRAPIPGTFTSLPAATNP